jgi:2-polyprenyl-3-methyl-5-hydroxy-6-metoxy-1,4-benzoquinol methylase
LFSRRLRLPKRLYDLHKVESMPFTGQTPTLLIKPIRPPEKDIYKTMWDKPEYRVVSPGEMVAKEFLRQAKPMPNSPVIDLGCGTGRGSKALSLFGNLDVTAVDFASNCLDEDVQELVDKGVIKFVEHDLTKPLDLRATYGFCTDVLEHIPTEDVDKVLNNCLNACQNVFFQIATEDDVMGALIGHPLHLTVKPYSWWLQKFAEKECKVMWSQETSGNVLFYVSAWKTAKDFLKTCKISTPDEIIVNNVKHSLDIKGLNKVVHHPENDVEAMIVGGSPSLAKNIEKIRELREQGVKLIAMNGAYKYCIDQGIKPSALVIVDPLEHNARFADPIIDNCKYFIASQCHPKVFENVPKDRTYLWHTGVEKIKEILEERKEPYVPVPGGSTVLLRTIPLFRILGFKRFHVFGCDSCLEDGAHHAYAQKENDNQVIIPVTVGNKVFYCNPWMLSQAQEFIDMVKLFGDHLELEVYDGLLRHILETGALHADLKEQ